MDLKKSRGRPPMDCTKINESTFGRKTVKAQKKAQLDKCASRSNHATKPCMVKDNKCVAKVNTEAKSKSCKDVSFDKTQKYTNLGEKKIAFASACKKHGEDINKNCLSAKTKGSRLICRDSSVAQQKQKKNNKISMLK